jgi:hypothetical protein
VEIKHKRFQLVADAADEILDYIERLAGETWIDVDRLHLPVRKALHFIDGPGSGWGARIPFSLYKKVVDRISREHSRLREDEGEVGDVYNDSFARDIKDLQSQGHNEDDSLLIKSGASNLTMLAEASVEGIIETIKGILPDLPIPDHLTERTSPIKDFMMQGIQSVPSEISDGLEALSPTWSYLRNKEHETGPERVASYAYSYALNHVGTNVAKLWEAWAMYPKLKEISLTARNYQMRLQGHRYFSSQEIERYTNINITHWHEYLQHAAVLFSNVIAESTICCLVAVWIDMKNAREGITMLKNIMVSLNRISQNEMQVTLNFDSNRFAKEAERSLESMIIILIDQHYTTIVKELKRFWERTQAKLKGDVQCVPLEMLFDGVLGIMADLKFKIINRVRRLISLNGTAWSLEIGGQLNLIEKATFNRYIEVINLIERLMAFESKCELDEEARDQRALDLIS